MKARTDVLYLYDIAECCRKTAEYVDGVSEDTFKQNSLIQDAVVRNIEIIGEASKCLSARLREANPQIEWKEIMRMRDKIVHHYFKLDLDVVWQTANVDIPALGVQVEAILLSLADLERQ